jgi:hypothetical protein
MQELIQEMNELSALLDKELDACKLAGVQYAENESRYRMALRVEILRERANGTPVTIIGDVCRGKPEIAELKRFRDSSEAIYKASQEAINVYKLRIRVIDAQMSREWNSN